MISRARVRILLETMLRHNLGQVVHTYVLLASVTKQYNLVLAAGEVTAGLAESNSSLPPGG